MKNYEKPEIQITSYEAETIMLSGGTVQTSKDINSVTFNTIDF
jgi:hypothetical protein